MASQAMASPPSATRNPSVAPMATMNSDMLTVPMIWLGAIRPAAMSVDVVTGPQPPPPTESMKPPTRPSGPSSTRRGSLNCRAALRPKTVRSRTTTPSVARMTDTQGAATSAAM